MASNDKKPDTTNEAPVSPYDFLTMGMVSRLDKDIHKAVGKDGQQMIVKEYGLVERTYIFTSSGILCGNCGANIASEDQLACDECGIGYRVMLLIGL